jgi:hypothetical protein
MALSFLVSMAATSPASAESVNGLRAQIPFDFYIGDRAVSAGDYTVIALTADGIALRFYNVGNSRGSATALTIEARLKRLSKDPCKFGRCRARLVFHKYGDKYFLASVWGAGDNGRALAESKLERSLRKEIRAARNAAAAEMEVVTIDTH